MDGVLVSYEYGSGAAWGFVRDASDAEIHRQAPEVIIHHEAPSWMSTAEYTCLREQSVAVEELTPDALFEVSRMIGAALAS